MNNETIDKTAVENEDQLQLTPDELGIVNEMIEAGVLHGRKHSKINPKMTKYIASTRRGVDIIDLLKTKEMLDRSISFLKDMKEKKLPLLVVGTMPAVRDLVKDFAQKMNFSFVTERWLGGTLTNFKIISQRIGYYKKMRDDQDAGRLNKYTKKERLLINRDLNKMKKNFEGLEEMVDLPAALLVVNTEEHQTVVREANRLGIPVIGLINTNGDPDKIQYPIPCNDGARSSIKLILDKIAVSL